MGVGVGDGVGAGAGPGAWVVAAGGVAGVGEAAGAGVDVVLWDPDVLLEADLVAGWRRVGRAEAAGAELTAGADPLICS